MFFPSQGGRSFEGVRWCEKQGSMDYKVVGTRNMWPDYESKALLSMRTEHGCTLVFNITSAGVHICWGAPLSGDLENCVLYEFLVKLWPF